MGTPAESVEPAVATRYADYLELTKPRLGLLVLLTTLVGFVVAAPPRPDALVLAATLIGTALVVGGANALNQYAERHLDALMERTRDRPLPDGRLLPDQALAFGAIAAVAGLAVLALGADLLAAVLAAVAMFAYVFLYTPLKTRTPLSLLVGAVPGAIPPLIGWAAARGSLDAGAWALFALLFLWQPPHFLAIARLHRDDYLRGGFSIGGLQEEGRRAGVLQAVAFCLLLVPTAMLPAALGIAGRLYVWGALILGLCFLGASVLCLTDASRRADRRAFHASLLYLGGVMVLLLLGS